jgi:hypothetical protein
MARTMRSKGRKAVSVGFGLGRFEMITSKCSLNGISRMGHLVRLRSGWKVDRKMRKYQIKA